MLHKMELIKILPNKLKASVIHFSLSFIVFVFLFFIITQIWYPGPYFESDGGWQGIQLVIAIDLILGPLMTFLIFNPNKKRREIISDLSIVALIQISVLSWGVYTIYDQRPFAISFYKMAFYVITHDQIAVQNTNEKLLYQLSEEKPPILFSRPPRTSEEYDAYVRQINNYPISDWAVDSLFESTSNNLEELNNISINTINRFNNDTEIGKELQQKMDSITKTHASFTVVPFVGRYNEALLFIDGGTGKLIDYIVLEQHSIFER